MIEVLKFIVVAVPVALGLFAFAYLLGKWLKTRSRPETDPIEHFEREVQ